MPNDPKTVTISESTWGRYRPEPFEFENSGEPLVIVSGNPPIANFNNGILPISDGSVKLRIKGGKIVHVSVG
jgi:hypothetical protein